MEEYIVLPKKWVEEELNFYTEHIEVIKDAIKYMKENNIESPVKGNALLLARMLEGKDCLNQVLITSKDLKPVLEDAFNEGFEDGIIASFGDNTDGGSMFRIKESEKQEYINNFKL